MKTNHALDNEIHKIIRQEEELVFEKFDSETAFKIGCALIDKAKKENAVYAINISLNKKQLFHFSMDAAAPDNDNWLRRKENTVYHFHKSSMRVALEFSKNKWEFYPQFGLPAEDFANSGGSFPISIKNTGVVGAVTISGLPEEIDHAYVVEVIGDYLNKE